MLVTTIFTMPIIIAITRIIVVVPITVLYNNINDHHKNRTDNKMTMIVLRIAVATSIAIKINDYNKNTDTLYLTSRQAQAPSLSPYLLRPLILRDTAQLL